MPSTVEILKRQQKAREHLRSIAYSIGTLGDDLRRVYQKELGEELVGYAERLHQIHDELSSAESDDISEQLRQQQQSTANMINGVLAGLGVLSEKSQATVAPDES